jgi:N-acetylmuramoyl-L-alanine amidase-like protein
MSFHKRAEWTKTPPANANKVVRSLLKGVAIHWNGPAVPNSALTDPRSYLEGVRRFHTNTNGWSDIAYNLAVDQNGDIWQLRGLGYQSGANGDTKVNDQYLAILCVLGQGQKPSPEMVDGVARAVRRFRVRYPGKKAIVGHRDIRAGGTDCPGDKLYRHLKAGDFKPKIAPPKPPAPVCNHLCPAHCPKVTP